MPSAVVGLLRVLLTANTAEFSTGLKAAANQAQLFSRDMNAMGRQVTAVGASLTKTLTLPLLAVGAGSAKLAMDFESSFAGVRKTVDATDKEFAQLAQGFRNLAKTIPVNVNELNKIGEAAGALGIKKADILEFTRVMAQLGVTTNLTSDQAATSIAQIQNIFNASGKDTSNFASALVALGNAGASTESQIVDFASRLAGAGHQIGLSQQSVLGFSSALANMGLNAELGGTALSTVMSRMSVAVDTGGKKLENFAKVAGMTSDAFKTLFKADAAEAILRFTEGLGKAGTSGQNLTIILRELGLKGSNVQDVMKRLAGGAGQMREAVELSSKAWRENSALTEEARKRFETTQSQLTLLWNRIQDVGITIGNALLPAIKSITSGLNTLIPAIESLAGGFAGLPGPVQALIVGLGAIVAAAGPVLFIFGQLASSASSLAAVFATKGIATKVLAAAFGTVTPAAAGATGAIGLMGSALALLVNPITLGVAAIGLLAFGIYKVVTAETDLEKSLRENTAAFKTHTAEIESALATYRTLSEKQIKTKDETAALDRVTRALAEASGLSVEAFNREERASGTLTRALAAQLRERQALLAQATEDARKAAVGTFSALAQAQKDLDAVLAGKATKTIRDPEGLSAGITMPLNAAERIEEADRLKAKIKELGGEAVKAREAFEGLASPVSTDESDRTFQNMVRNLHNVKDAATTAGSVLGDKLGELNEKLDDADSTIKGFSKTTRTTLTEAIRSGAFSMKELVEASGLSEIVIKRFTDQLKDSAKEGTKHERALKAQQKAVDELASSMDTLTAEQVTQIESLLDQKKAEGDIVKVLKVTKTQVNEVQAAQKARIKQDDEAYEDRKDIAKGEIKLIGDHLNAFIDAKEKELEAEEHAQERLMQAGMAGAALKVRQLEVQRDAEILAHRESKAAIDAFYDYEVKIALGTADTIEERMRRAGVRKKVNHVAQLRAEQEFYDFMLLHSDQFTKADIANQRARVNAAKAAAGEIAKAYGEAISQIGTLLSQIGGMIGGSSGALISQFGGITTGLGNATTATAKYMKAVQDGTATTADAIGQYGLMISTVWGLGKALVALTDFFDGAGNAEAAMRAQGGNVLRDFQLAARLAGQNLSILSTPQNADQQKTNLALINRAIEDNKRMMDAYNLTWRDFGDITGEFITQTAKDLARDFKTLTARGVDGAKVIKGMSGSLNQLLIDAVETGKKIPAALKPMIEQMIRMGLVTEDAARAMLGLAADTMPSLADIKAAAERYGLTLDELGGKVKQLSINEAAKQIVKDFGILMAAGVPLAVLMKDIPGGFREQVQGMVKDALTLGLTLPAAMKPILQALLDAGFLTDAFGNKLTSLDGLTFAESIEQSVDRLITKLDDLISTLKGVGDEFELTASRARGAAEIIGKAIPRGTGGGTGGTGDGAGDGDGEGTGDGDTGETAVPRAAGGVVPSYSSVGARILKFIPKGTDTVPMMATPGEGVLNTRAMRWLGSDALHAMNTGQVSLPATGTTGAGDSAPRVVNLSVTVSGEVISTQERAQEMGRELAKEIRRGGDLLTKWQDLPLVREGS